MSAKATATKTAPVLVEYWANGYRRTPQVRGWWVARVNGRTLWFADEGSFKEYFGGPQYILKERDTAQPEFKSSSVFISDED
jgi:hypothetical protein